MKCPKCKASMRIPAAKSAPVTASAAVARPAVDPMEALLKEANIGPVSRGGPECPDCAAELSAGAVICVECGFNLETGQRLRTTSDEDGSADTGLTDAEKIMKKAEAAIEDTPIGADEQDFGDGGDSFVIAGVAAVILAIAVVIGLVIVFSMDQISTMINSGGISFIASCALWVLTAIWISFVAFRASMAHGLGCVLTGGLYCIFFGFLQGKALLLPTIIMIVALVVGGLSGLYVYYGEHGFAPLPT